MMMHPVNSFDAEPRGGVCIFLYKLMISCWYMVIALLSGVSPLCNLETEKTHFYWMSNATCYMLLQLHYGLCMFTSLADIFSVVFHDKIKINRKIVTLLSIMVLCLCLPPIIVAFTSEASDVLIGLCGLTVPFSIYVLVNICTTCLGLCISDHVSRLSTTSTIIVNIDMSLTQDTNVNAAPAQDTIGLSLKSLRQSFQCSDKIDSTCLICLNQLNDGEDCIYLPCECAFVTHYNCIHAWFTVVLESGEPLRCLVCKNEI